MKKIIIIIAIVLVNLQAMAQLKPDRISVSLSNTHTALPLLSFPGLFYKQLHPGIQIGAQRNWNEQEKSRLFQTLNLGYFFHRYSQHGLMLYTELAYQKKIRRFYAGGRIGAGYMHSISDINSFEQNGQSSYRQIKNSGRPQVMTSLLLDLGYRLNNNINIFFDYQMWFQFPFVKSYVPILPNSTVQIGSSIPLTLIKKETNDEE